MSKEDRFEMNGVVIDILKGAKFRVELENGHICTCTLCGRMMTNSIKVIKGDNVIIDLSIKDPKLENGRIIRRLNK